MDLHTGSVLTLPALQPADVPARTGSSYPTAAQRAAVAGRSKRALGDALGLQNFGVNLVELAPGAASSLLHWHSRQDEFVYVLAGELTLVTEKGVQTLLPGSCAGFPGGRSEGHCLRNDGAVPAIYLEVGDRLPGDRSTYPTDDLAARQKPAGYEFTRRDGSPYTND